MIDNVREICNIAWADVRFLRHTIVSVMLASLMSPLLYLLAFGYGLGRGDEMEGVTYIAFIIPGIVALSALSSSFSSTSSRMNVQRLYYRNFDEMMLCPLRVSSIVLGKAMLGIIRGLLSCAIIYVLGMFLTDELLINAPFIISLLVSCLAFSLLGETAAFLAKSHQSMTTFNTLVILPMTFLCGTFFSVSSMPDWIQTILYALPLTYSSALLRESALGWDFSWHFLLVLIVLTIILFWINVYLIKSKRI